MRWGRRALEQAVEAASDAPSRAQALYDLGLFHDNNSREGEALPCYEAALAAGLTGETRAPCLAWLASSLFKMSSPAEARQRLIEARELATDAELRRFLTGLERRLVRRSGAIELRPYAGSLPTSLVTPEGLS